MSTKAYYAVILILIALILGIMISAFIPEGEDRSQDVLYQISTIDALMQSVYDGIMPAGELKKHGNFGIGTFDGLEGEMVALDGRYYQVKSDGVAYPVNDSIMIPFATVTYYESDQTIHVNGTGNFTQLTGAIDAGLPSKNLFYAIRIDGTFPYIKTRSIPKQEKPYVSLVNASKNQSVFELYNTTGTIVGFYSPQYVSGVNVPGYHLHYITSDGKAGGHVLDMSTGEVDVSLDITPDFYMYLPTSGDFIGKDLTKDLHEELKQVEN